MFKKVAQAQNKKEVFRYYLETSFYSKNIANKAGIIYNKIIIAKQTKEEK